jgi:hypothetical protein
MLMMLESIPREHCLARARFWSTDAEVTVVFGMVIDPEMHAELAIRSISVVVVVTDEYI